MILFLIINFYYLNNGKKVTDSLERADAHPYGARPFKRENYINKFNTLTSGIISKREGIRFLKEVQNLRKIRKGHLSKVNLEINNNQLKKNKKNGIF